MIPAPVHAIPTINFSGFRHGSPAARAKVVTAIGKASEDYGFMSLVGHGLQDDVLEAALAAGRRFFALPEEEKRKIAGQSTMRGYMPILDVAEVGERPGGQEAFCMGHPVSPADPAVAALPLHAPTPWPELDGFRDEVEAVYAALWALGQDVLRAIAIYLGQGENFFEDALHESYSKLRLDHYPPREPTVDVAGHGVRPHVDQGLITLLLQDENGELSVYGPHDEWLPVRPNTKAVVVNVGNMLRRWTNGRFRAPLHMVISYSARECYSIPLFVQPSFHTVIDPRALVGSEPQDEDFELIVAGELVCAQLRAAQV
jgi:isopenicillin N synthase-like dioxygenase